MMFTRLKKKVQPKLNYSDVVKIKPILKVKKLHIDDAIKLHDEYRITRNIETRNIILKAFEAFVVYNINRYCRSWTYEERYELYIECLINVCEHLDTYDPNYHKSALNGFIHGHYSYVIFNAVAKKMSGLKYGTIQRYLLSKKQIEQSKNEVTQILKDNKLSKEAYEQFEALEGDQQRYLQDVHFDNKTKHSLLQPDRILECNQALEIVYSLCKNDLEKFIIDGFLNDKDIMDIAREKKVCHQYISQLQQSIFARAKERLNNENNERTTDNTIEN